MRKLTLKEALFKEGLTEMAQYGLLALTGEERIKVLCHIGTKPPPDDRYAYLTSVVKQLSPLGAHKEDILCHPVVDGKKFPIVNQKAQFV